MNTARILYLRDVKRFRIYILAYLAVSVALIFAIQTTDRYTNWDLSWLPTTLLIYVAPIALVFINAANDPLGDPSAFLGARPVSKSSVTIAKIAFIITIYILQLTVFALGLYWVNAPTSEILPIASYVSAPFLATLIYANAFGARFPQIKRNGGALLLIAFLVPLIMYIGLRVSPMDIHNGIDNAREARSDQVLLCLTLIFFGLLSHLPVLSGFKTTLAVLALGPIVGALATLGPSLDLMPERDLPATQTQGVTVDNTLANPTKESHQLIWREFWVERASDDTFFFPESLEGYFHIDSALHRFGTPKGYDTRNGVDIQDILQPLRSYYPRSTTWRLADNHHFGAHPSYSPGEELLQRPVDLNAIISGHRVAYELIASVNLGPRAKHESTAGALLQIESISIDGASANVRVRHTRTNLRDYFEAPKSHHYYHHEFATQFILFHEPSAEALYFEPDRPHKSRRSFGANHATYSLQIALPNVQLALLGTRPEQWLQEARLDAYKLVPQSVVSVVIKQENTRPIGYDHDPYDLRGAESGSPIDNPTVPKPRPSLREELMSDLLNVPDNFPWDERKTLITRIEGKAEGHLEVLINLLPLGESDEIALEVIENLANPSHLPALAEALDRDERFARVIAKLGWTDSARRIARQLVRRQLPYDWRANQELVQVATENALPEDYPALARRFVNAGYGHDALFDALKDLPDFPIHETLKRTWTRALATNEPIRNLAPLVAQFVGDKEALRLALSFDTTNFNERERERLQETFKSCAPESENDNAENWLRRRFTELRFNPDSGKFEIANEAQP